MDEIQAGSSSRTGSVATSQDVDSPGQTTEIISSEHHVSRSRPVFRSGCLSFMDTDEDTSSEGAYSDDLVDAAPFDSDGVVPASSSPVLSSPAALTPSADPDDEEIQIESLKSISSTQDDYFGALKPGQRIDDPRNEDKIAGRQISETSWTNQGARRTLRSLTGSFALSVHAASERALLSSALDAEAETTSSASSAQTDSDYCVSPELHLEETALTRSLFLEQLDKLLSAVQREHGKADFEGHVGDKSEASSDTDDNESDCSRPAPTIPAAPSTILESQLSTHSIHPVASEHASMSGSETPSPMSSSRDGLRDEDSSHNLCDTSVASETPVTSLQIIRQPPPTKASKSVVPLKRPYEISDGRTGLQQGDELCAYNHSTEATEMESSPSSKRRKTSAVESRFFIRKTSLTAKAEASNDAKTPMAAPGRRIYAQGLASLRRAESLRSDVATEEDMMSRMKVRKRRN